MQSDPWPILLTAGLTLVVALLVQSFVQFYAAPRAETRKRREDRWERDLLALGEFLTFEQAEAAKALFHELWMGATWRTWTNDPDVNHDRMAELRRESSERMGELEDEYRRADARVDWLSGRVCAVDPDAQRLIAFKSARRRYMIAQAQAMTLASQSRYGDNPPSPDDVDEARETERKSVQEMVHQIEKLADHPPPRASLRVRIAKRLTPNRAG